MFQSHLIPPGKKKTKVSKSWGAEKRIFPPCRDQKRSSRKDRPLCIVRSSTVIKLIEAALNVQGPIYHFGKRASLSVRPTLGEEL